MLGLYFHCWGQHCLISNVTDLSLIHYACLPSNAGSVSRHGFAASDLEQVPKTGALASKPATPQNVTEQKYTIPDYSLTLVTLSSAVYKPHWCSTVSFLGPLHQSVGLYAFTIPFLFRFCCYDDVLTSVQPHILHTTCRLPCALQLPTAPARQASWNTFVLAAHQHQFLVAKGAG